MAKKKAWDGDIDKYTPWDGNKDTDHLPVAGTRIEQFLKKQLDSKAGIFHYDTTNNRYLVFADEEARDTYLENPIYNNDLLIGTFDAPFNYNAEINLISKSYNVVFLGKTGNIVEFIFDIKNKNGASTGDSVTCTYTIQKGNTKKVVREQYVSGTQVSFSVDEYLQEGTNTITIGIVGHNTLAATTAAIQYVVVNLSITDNLDISKIYNLTKRTATVAVPFTVKGYGTKTVEWYLDGELLPLVRQEDEVVENEVSRVKYIMLDNLSHGRHSLQFRVSTVIDGNKYYSDIIYKELIVNTGQEGTVGAISTMIPTDYGVVNSDTPLQLYGCVQYLPYPITFAIYNSKNEKEYPVSVLVKEGDTSLVIGNVMANNERVNTLTYTPKTAGSKLLVIKTENEELYSIPILVSRTTMGIEEITSGLVLNFDGKGKNNYSAHKKEWSYGTYNTNLKGFSFNKVNGWLRDNLLLSGGTELSIPYKPFAKNPTELGKTIELEFKADKVSNDDLTLIGMSNGNGVGLTVTSSKIILKSAAGNEIYTEYKAGEFVRISVVIHKSNYSSDKCTSFIYVNGILSRAIDWLPTDSYVNDSDIVIKGYDDAQIEVKQLRIYDAVLTSDQILNNYILYRDTVGEMREVYERNNIYFENSTEFNYERMLAQLPVVIVTGDIPTLENTTNKNLQITVDIEGYNLQDPTKNFKWKNVALRPQGTSSMAYPKKNFRPYLKKLDITEVYDYEGKLVPGKTYQFKDGAMPVSVWCWKADYAESSSTHNTGIARLWNDVMKNAQIEVSGKVQYALRTRAQQAAISGGYPYDVRTTVDGFPILLFYHKTSDEPLIFIGKYNWNNDKSTEAVFGFKDIPGFDNSKMQCWEILNNGHPLALFTDISKFDDDWEDAYESRYPDTSSPDTSDLKAFSVWMNNVNGDAGRFATEKWDHMDVYKMAAYYIYLMRFGAVDQMVKNAMFTSEDGIHWYFINYDNDTINGLINTGALRTPWNANRQTKDADGTYLYAGNASVLWNMLEGDEEFVRIVSKVDNSLYSAGLRYEEVIKMFDDKQADKWVERVYNEDARYKYIGPFQDRNINNLFMLQGKRDIHRKFWLAKRFNYFDSIFSAGAYKSNSIEIKCLNDTPAGKEFGITAGEALKYGYGINNYVRESGVSLAEGESKTFTINENLNLGDVLRIYLAPSLRVLNLATMSDRLSVIDVSKAYNPVVGSKLRELIIGGNLENRSLTTISGINLMNSLKRLDLTNLKALNSIDISELTSLESLYCAGSSLSDIKFPSGGALREIRLTGSFRNLVLEDCVNLHSNNILHESLDNLATIDIKGCTSLSNDWNFIHNWLSKGDNSQKILRMDNVAWKEVNASELVKLSELKEVNLRGYASLNEVDEATVTKLKEVFGDKVLDKNSAFYVKAPNSVFLIGPHQIYRGDSARYECIVFSADDIEIKSIKYYTTGYRTSIDDNGILTTEEVDNARSFSIKVQVITDLWSIEKEITVSFLSYHYPSLQVIIGNVLIENDIEEYSYRLLNTGDVNIEHKYNVVWELTGEAVDEGILQLIYHDKKNARVQCLNKVLNKRAILKCTLKKSYDDSIISSKSIELEVNDPNIIMTSSSNPFIMKAIYALGLCNEADKLTKDEAILIDSNQLKQIMDSVSKDNTVGNNLIPFTEFKYFKGVIRLLAFTFGSGIGDYGEIVIPESVNYIERLAFQGAKFRKMTFLSKKVEFLGTAYLGGPGLNEINFGKCNIINAHRNEPLIMISKNPHIIGGENISDNTVVFQSKGLVKNDSKAVFIDNPYAIEKVNDIWTNSGLVKLSAGKNKLTAREYIYFGKNKQKEKEIFLDEGDYISEEKLPLLYRTFKLNCNIKEVIHTLKYTSLVNGEEVTEEVLEGENYLPVKSGNVELSSPNLSGYNNDSTPYKFYWDSSALKSIDSIYYPTGELFIQHMDGTLYTENNWKSKGFSKNDANGIAITSDKTKFVLSLTQISGCFYVRSFLAGNTKTRSEAFSDFDGWTNTKLIFETEVKTTLNSSLFQALENFKYPNGKGGGYIPSLGQMYLAYKLGAYRIIRELNLNTPIQISFTSNVDAFSPYNVLTFTSDKQIGLVRPVDTNYAFVAKNLEI